MSCLANNLEMMYAYTDVMTNLSGGNGISAYEGTAIKCGYNALYKKINLTATAYQNFKSQTVPKDSTQAKNFLVCLNNKTLSPASRQLTDQDRATAYQCEQSTGADAGVGAPPLTPTQPGMPPTPVVTTQHPGTAGRAVPWYSSPLVWSLIALGVFLLIIIIIIIATSVNKSPPTTFSWAGNKWY